MTRQFAEIKNKVLGKNYDLSVAYTSPVAMRRAMKYKKMSPAKMRETETSNVLAFPLSKTSGEILICKEASKPYTTAYLFIHGCMHLKGFKHGATMDAAEERLLKALRLSKRDQ